MRRVRYRAAGGVVTDGARVLVLRRPSRNEMRLPKGHVDAGEKDEAAARREVVEETGYAELERLADLGEQKVEFPLRASTAWIVRDEHYFLFRLAGPGVIRRSLYDDHQFEPVWMTWDEAIAALSFEPEREWVRRARRALAPDQSGSQRG